VARDPDTIQREIEQARDALAETLDELSVKASPQRFVETAKTSVRSKLADPKIKYALIGAGALVGLLIVRKLFR
jgi:chaperonin GroEL (HSP60 family)